MIRQFVSSSDLRSVGYESGTLEIEFNSGGIYQYFNVPQNVFEGLMKASSHGQFFHRYVKDVYSFRRIR